MSVSWKLCAVDACGGAAAGDGRVCVAHVAPDELPALLAGSRSRIDARGVEVTAALMRDLVRCCTNDKQQPVFGACDFSRAEFVDVVNLAGVRFDGNASFTGAVFRERARFSGAYFARPADFSGAAFEGPAAFGAARFARVRFIDAHFRDEAQFSSVRWRGHVQFTRAAFDDAARFGRGTFSAFARFDGARFASVSFSEARFERTASFRGTAFDGDARFFGAGFEGLARFERAEFLRQARFDDCTFTGEADFAAARFGGAASWQSVHCARSLSFRWATFEGKLGALASAVVGIDLDRAVCKQPVALSVATPSITCDGAEFRSGVNLFARWAELRLDDASFSGSSILSGASKLAGINEEPVVDALREPGGAVARRSIPRLVSALRTDLGGVIFDDVDLAQTRVSGAKNLDRVRLNGSVVLARTPKGPRVGWSFPLLWWWSRRQVLGEEATWRALGRKRSGWRSASDRSPLATARDGRQARRDAERIAGTYRDLRKGREELLNAPGAADLYYGEMEMRRHAAARLSVERLVLDGYWLVSGYALRAGRALVCLLVTLALAAVAFHQFGFADLRRPFVGQSASVAAPSTRPRRRRARSRTISASSARLRRCRRRGSTPPPPRCPARRSRERA